MKLPGWRNEPLHTKVGRWLLAGSLAASAMSAAAEPGVSPGRIVLGQSIGVATGPVVNTAAEIVNGLAAYIAAANRAGGIHGRQLSLRTLDDGFVPGRTAENTRAMIEGGEVFLMAAGLGTPHTLEAMKLAEPAGLPLICPFTGADPLHSRFSKVMFHVRASYRSEVEKMVEQLTSLGIRRIAMLYQNDAFGQEGLRYLQESLKKRGLQVEAAAPVERGSEDVAAAVRILRDARPQAVVMFAVPNQAATFVRQMKAAGSFPQFMTISLNAHAEFAALLGADSRGVGHSQVMPSPWDVAMPLVREYQAAMRAQGKANYSFTSLEGYVCGKVIGEGLLRAGRNPTREGFLKALESMNPYNLGGYEIRFSGSSHAGSAHVGLTVMDAKGRFLK